uniref:Uncharacterized protein n=1 Tax=Moniliophthora roreri TaxID=221103 RepID=A0A0W0FJH3_MONRR
MLQHFFKEFFDITKILTFPHLHEVSLLLGDKFQIWSDKQGIIYIK